MSRRKASQNRHRTVAAIASKHPIEGHASYRHHGYPGAGNRSGRKALIRARRRGLMFRGPYGG